MGQLGLVSEGPIWVVLLLGWLEIRSQPAAHY